MSEHSQNQSSFHQEVRKRFRLVPNFFMSTQDALGIIGLRSDLCGPHAVRARPKGVATRCWRKTLRTRPSASCFYQNPSFWTVVHPGIEMEDDVKQLMEKNLILGLLDCCQCPLLALSRHQ